MTQTDKPPTYNRPISEFTVNAVNRHLQEAVPLLVEQFLMQESPGRDQRLPGWFLKLFDERLERYCKRFVDQQLGRTLSDGLDQLVQPMVTQLVQQLTPQLEDLVRQVMTEEVKRQ